MSPSRRRRLDMGTPLRKLLAGAAAWLLLALPQAQAAVGMKAPDFAGTVWINSGPRSVADLRGRIVLVEFWTFGCYNCRNVEPHVKEWYRKYADQGLVVIGVHSPEFKYEHNVESVKRYIDNHHIPYPVVIDNDFAVWNRYRNRYWPAMYLIDKQGVIRMVRIGEGGYAEM